MFLTDDVSGIQLFGLWLLSIKKIAENYLRKRQVEQGAKLLYTAHIVISVFLDVSIFNFSIKNRPLHVFELMCLEPNYLNTNFFLIKK